MTRFPPGANWVGAAILVSVVIVLSIVAVVPQFSNRVVGSEGGNGGVAVGPSGIPGSIDPSALAGGNGPNGPGGSGAGAGAGNLACAPGKNGGATDTGVTGTEIKLATTLAQSGTVSAFLGEAGYGIQAVIDATNRAGGVCGRIVKLTPVDDGFDSHAGEQDITAFIQEGTFALPVVPSSQGLDAASRNGLIDNAGIPVIGTDGMLYSQYSDPLIWPVASSTITTAHIAAISAFKEAGARSFGIVYDSKYKFGKEGETAFVNAVKRLGGHVDADVPVDKGKQDYSVEAHTFENGCHPCDMTFMLLEPETALSWIRSDPSGDRLYEFGSKRTAGPQTLFVSSFGQQCGQPCNGMWLWTGFKPPEAPYDNDPAVKQYTAALQSVGPHADPKNQFTEGSYLGMQLFVEALKKTGPNLTRARLRDAMDSMTYDGGLTEKLTWSKGNHYANTSMLGFTIQFSQGFGGFQYQQTGWVKDPWYSEDHP